MIHERKHVQCRVLAALWYLYHDIMMLMVILIDILMLIVILIDHNDDDEDFDEMIMLMVILICYNHDDHDATRIKGLLDWNDNVNSDCLFLKREEVKKRPFY